jgi:hypothetical protein
MLPTATWFPVFVNPCRSVTIAIPFTTICALMLVNKASVFGLDGMSGEPLTRPPKRMIDRAGRRLRCRRSGLFESEIREAIGPVDFLSVARQISTELSATAKILFRPANGEVADMSTSLLDECLESIRKIAETQPPEGKQAILTMAEILWANLGPAASERQISRSQDALSPQCRRLCSRPTADT